MNEKNKQHAPFGRARAGYIYEEFANPGNVHTAGRFVKGVGMAPRKRRLVPEMTVNYKRYRFRPSSYSKCEAWIKRNASQIRQILRP